MAISLVSDRATNDLYESPQITANQKSCYLSPAPSSRMLPVVYLYTSFWCLLLLLLDLWGLWGQHWNANRAGIWIEELLIDIHRCRIVYSMACEILDCHLGAWGYFFTIYWYCGPGSLLLLLVHLFTPLQEEHIIIVFCVLCLICTQCAQVQMTGQGSREWWQTPWV